MPSRIVSTPKRLASNRRPVCLADKSKDAVAEGWRQELLDRINIYDCKTDKYIRTFVPSRARCSFPCDFADAFSDWTPVAGKEAESYPVLVSALFNGNARPP